MNGKRQKAIVLYLLLTGTALLATLALALTMQASGFLAQALTAEGLTSLGEGFSLLPGEADRLYFLGDHPLQVQAGGVLLLDQVGRERSFVESEQQAPYVLASGDPLVVADRDRADVLVLTAAGDSLVLTSAGRPLSADADNRRLLLLSARDGGHTLMSFNLKTAETEFTLDWTGDKVPMRARYSPSGRTLDVVFFEAGEEEPRVSLRRYREDGSLLSEYTTQLSGLVSTFVYDEAERIVLLSSDGLYRLEPESGEGVFFPMPDAIALATTAGRVHALSRLNSATAVWRLDEDGASEVLRLDAPISLPPVSDGRHLVLATPATLTLYDALTGRLIADYPLNDPLRQLALNSESRLLLATDRGVYPFRIE